MQRALEKWQLSLQSLQCQAQSWPEGAWRAGPLGRWAPGAEEAALRIGLCRLRMAGQGWPRVQGTASLSYGARIEYPRVAAERAHEAF